MPAGKISENNTRINVTIPKDLKLQAEIYCNYQAKQILSNLIVTLIKDYVQSY